MSTVTTILILFGGCGVIAFIANWFTSRGGNKSNIMNAVHKLTQKIGMDKVDKLEANQNVLKTEIEIKESVAEETRIKIGKIQENAAAEINEVLKEDNITKIHTVIDSEWGDL